jgi:hypothetical protein
VLNGYRSYKAAIIAGVGYGYICQLAIRKDILSSLFGVMSFGFVFILPFLLGVITIAYARESQQRSWMFRIFAPLGTVLISLIFSLIVGWEGAICAVFAGLIYSPLASCGGILAGIFITRRKRQLNSSFVILLLISPFISAYVENQFDLPISLSHVETSIEINSPAADVWTQIIRVPRITEPLNGYFYRIGFPKPLEATLSHEGIGGVRQASFERGLVFVETVDTWEPNRKLSFSIKPDAESVPTTTLDEHVLVGGRYFDVLRGTYEIVPLPDGAVLLKLSSDIRVSTRFNFYAEFWAKMLMYDIQNTILKVIKERAEKSTAQR